jgi:hypothetical protein
MYTPMRQLLLFDPLQASTAELRVIECVEPCVSVPEKPQSVPQVELLRPTLAEAGRPDRRQLEQARGLLEGIRAVEAATLPGKPAGIPKRPKNKGLYRNSPGLKRQRRSRGVI